MTAGWTYTPQRSPHLGASYRVPFPRVHQLRAQRTHRSGA